MISRSTLLHLRIPFSFYLLPVFLFAFSLTEGAEIFNTIIVLVALHLFLYPASNGYNSYFDKDEESIGGLENPPEVSRELYWYALIFDAIAIFLGLLISRQFTLMMFIYGLVSKAYSHPSIRLKKMALFGWFIAGFFQGYFTFLMAVIGLTGIGFSEIFQAQLQIPAILSSVLLWGSYPMTQVYQHAEDNRRGDITISIKLGVLGTFHFTAIVFSLATAGFVYFYLVYHSEVYALTYPLFLAPVLGFFGYWYLNCRKDISVANFKNTMRLNFISALMMNAYFVFFYVSKSLMLNG